VIAQQRMNCRFRCQTKSYHWFVNFNPILLLAPALAVLYLLPLHADDGAASIAAGGVVVMGREPRITMAKEVLKISASKVVVDYDFRNDTDEDVVTEVAFPIPPYDLSMDQLTPAQQSFGDFRLWIEGAPAHFRMQARAFLKGKDLTPMLTGMHVDVATFGHATSNMQSADIQKLSASQRGTLVRAGLIDSGDNAPNWEVRKKFFWRQTFPAHKSVHIRHEYSPVVGSENSIKYAYGTLPDAGSAKELQNFCVDGQLATILQQIGNSKDRDAPFFYVDFILTTANTWKKPIEDFTLIVERPHRKDDLTDYVSFCWDGPVTRIDADHFSAKARGFIPTKELKIGFFGVEKSRF
jgi:hypothetical protein